MTPGGRTTIAATLDKGGAKFWSLLTDDPDKTVARRVWSHEVTIAEQDGRLPQLSVRQILSTDANDPGFVASAPGFVRQLAERCGLFGAMGPLTDEAETYRDAIETDGLVERLTDAKRLLPIVAISRTRQGELLIDPNQLAAKTIGLAHVVVVEPEATFGLTDRVGSKHSVFEGAVRLYMPDYDPDGSPYAHRLFLAETVARNPAKTEAWLREAVAADSLKRAVMNRDVFRFADIRTAALRDTASRLRTSGAGANEQLDIVREEAAALREEVEDARKEEEAALALAEQHEAVATEAKAASGRAAHRIKQLEEQLAAAKAGQPVQTTAYPTEWSELASWVDAEFPTKLELTPAARRSLKRAQFSDIELVCKCLEWLATEYRRARTDGGGGEQRGLRPSDGVVNEPCGGDAFEVLWGGRKQMSDWHLKSTTGVTRDPSRVLRIYYFWAPDDQVVVVTDLPSHRTTAIT